MRIAVTGATGFIGSHLVEALASRGHEVTCLARSPQRLQWIASLPVRVIYGDVCEPESLRDIVKDQEIVVHTAGITKAAGLDDYLRVNVGGTENLLTAVKKHAPRLRRFIFISSLEAMGPSAEGTPLGEDAEQKPLSMYGKSKSLAERSLRSFWDTIPMTVIRPPAVYGPRDRDIFKYFQLAARGFAPNIGYRNTISIAYVKNLVSGIVLSIERPLGSYRSYFFTDGVPVTWIEISELIAKALEKRPLRITVPAFAVQILGGISGLYTALTNRAVLLSPDKIETMKHEYWLISDQRARSELGYRSLFTTEQGIRETAQWYKSQGWL